MSKRNGFPTKTIPPATMRPLLIKDLPETVQIAIKKRAWRDDVSYEEAAADLLHDAEIERIVKHDMAIMRKQRRFDQAITPADSASAIAKPSRIVMNGGHSKGARKQAFVAGST